jgi:two-component system NarL family sensor kinase
MRTAKGFGDKSISTLYASALDSLTSSVALLDGDHDIIAVNEAWIQFARIHGVLAPRLGIGANYLALCRGLSAADAAKISTGLEGLLTGMPGPFRCEFTIPLPHPVWLRLSAVRVGFLQSPFLILAHEDITAQRRIQTNLRSATARLLNAEDAERRRIARELHDSATQDLTGANLMLAGLERASPAEGAAIRAEISGLISGAIEEIRNFSYLLHPPTLDRLGLAATVRQFIEGFARRAHMEVQVEIEGDLPQIAYATEIALYRVLQEAMANIHRHSNSRRATVDLKTVGDMVLLSVRDYGVGLPADPSASHGVGLTSMRLRLEFLNGRLSIREADPGLLIQAWAPYAPNDSL